MVGMIGTVGMVGMIGKSMRCFFVINGLGGCIKLIEYLEFLNMGFYNKEFLNKEFLNKMMYIYNFYVNRIEMI